ncbi:MAG: Crp/Fnr family transcriptional regulator [Elusimicrobia bacterium]|nr:Crp/Fnr family transcriptional regulator [Elusimicrobiota bacterium]
MTKPPILFQSLPGRVFTDVKKHFIRRSFRAQDLVFQEGDSPRSAFVLLSGLVKMVKFTRRERPLALEAITPGRLFGALALLDRRPFPASAIALTESEADEIPARVFNDLFDRYPAFARAVHEDIGEHLRHAQSMRTLAQEPAAQRVAAILSFLMPHRGDVVRIRREDVAELAGCIPETAIRVLSDFKRRGYIRTGWKEMTLADEAGLRSLIDSPS